MANPNRTVFKFRRGQGGLSVEEEAARHERRRAANPEFYRLMDAVSSGEMTPEEAVKKMEELT